MRDPYTVNRENSTMGIQLTIYRSDYVIAVLSPFEGKPSKLKVIKNKHTGELGELNKKQSLEILIQILAQQAFLNTSGLTMYEEMLKGDIEECIRVLLDKYNLKEKVSGFI